MLHIFVVLWYLTFARNLVTYMLRIDLLECKV